MGGLGGPNNVFNDVWLLDMEPGKELENSIDWELLDEHLRLVNWMNH